MLGDVVFEGQGKFVGVRVMGDGRIEMTGLANGMGNAHNALRSARGLVEHSDVNLRMFLIGDGASSARKGQKPATG